MHQSTPGRVLSVCAICTTISSASASCVYFLPKVHFLADRLALDQFHDEVMQGAGRTDVDSLHDIVVAKLGRDVSLLC